MRKAIIITMAALAGMGMASCKKDYTCSCTLTAKHDGEVIYSESSTEQITRSTKKDATNRCDQYRDDLENSIGYYAMYGVTTNATCNLK